MQNGQFLTGAVGLLVVSMRVMFWKVRLGATWRASTPVPGPHTNEHTKTTTTSKQVGFSYDSVVGQGQWWRLAAAAVSHVELLHLGFNASALWSLRGAERVLGSGYYARTSLLLAAGSQAVRLRVAAAFLTLPPPVH